MSNGFIYVVDAHFIDKIEENKYPGPKCLLINVINYQDFLYGITAISLPDIYLDLVFINMS